MYKEALEMKEVPSWRIRVQTKFKNVSAHAAHAPILSHYTSADVWNLRNHQKWPQTAEVKDYISLQKYLMEREFGLLFGSIASTNLAQI